jgi:hypothetical protein
MSHVWLELLGGCSKDEISGGFVIQGEMFGATCLVDISREP